jgi:putative sigma-54 modulation protein
MQIQIKGTKIDLTPELKDYVQEKMDMLEKYLGSIAVSHCEVELEKALATQNSGKIYRAEVNLSLPGELLRVEKTTDDINKAIDKVKDHLELMIKKYKEKKIDKKRGK